LSVGEVDAATGNDAEVTEEDRGLIKQLNEQNVMDMIQDSGEDRKFSFGSCTDAELQKKAAFSNKQVEKAGDTVDTSKIGIGFTCRKGLKPESPNQDSWFVLKVEHHQSIYAVFDGHGQKGHDVSQFIKENLPKLLLKDPRFISKDEAERSAMCIDCFKRMQTMIAAATRMNKINAQMSGSTGTVVIHNHEENKLTIAHVADSTCVLGTAGKGKALTRDHKPDLKDEKQRIEGAGGRVVFDGYANHRVYAKNGRYPGLNMSRAFGDLMGHADAGIIAVPEVSFHYVKPEDSHLFVCSDGVWEFMSPNEAMDIIREFPSAKATQAAEKLAKEAWDRWIAEEGGTVVDDITAIIIYLQEQA